MTSPRSILVTGAAGRLGTVLCHDLLSCGHTLRGIDLTSPTPCPSYLERGDLSQPEDVRRSIDGQQVLVHLANATSSGPERSNLDDFQRERTILANLIAAAEKAGVEKIIYASSIRVISGNRNGLQQTASRLPYLPLDEHTPYCITEIYALAKAKNEIALRALASRRSISVIILRLPFLTHTPAADHPIVDSAQPWLQMDEAFSYLTFCDAAELICHLVTSKLTGFRIYLPAAADNRLGLDPKEVIARHYSQIPLRGENCALSSLVDLSSLQRDLGWQPANRPTPDFLRRPYDWEKPAEPTAEHV